MKNLRLLAFFCCAAWCIQNLDAATSLSHIVSDHSAVIISVHDVPSVLREWQVSPWAKTWNDDQVKKYFAPLRAQMNEDDWNSKVKAKTGYTLTELLDFATGDAIMVVPDFEFARSTPPKTPSILIGVDLGSNTKKVESLLVKTAKDENAVDETSDFSGVTVHTLHSAAKSPNPNDTPTVWAMVEGKWLLSPSKDTLLAAIDAVRNGGVTEPWDQSERYARLQQRAPDSQIIFSVNMETIYSTLHDVIVEKSKDSPSGFDGDALLKALGLQAWREIYGTVRFADDHTDVHAGITYSEQTGLLKMAAYQDGPPPQPPLLPAKWASAGVSKFSLKEAYTALEGILEDFNPAISGLVQGQIRAMNKKLGIDLKRDLLGSLGDTIVGANAAPTDVSTNATASLTLTQFDQFFAISLTDHDTFAKAIDALRQSLGPDADALFKTREYLGEKIVSYVPPQNPNQPVAPRGINYAITKGYVLISVGSPAAIEGALQCLNGNQPTLWDKPDIKAAFAQMPSNASAFNYQDVRQMISGIFQSMSTAAGIIAARANTPPPPPQQGGDADNAPPQPVKPPPQLVDPTAQPDAATIAKYWDHAWGYVVRDSNGIHATSLIVYPK